MLTRDDSAGLGNTLRDEHKPPRLAADIAAKTKAIEDRRQFLERAVADLEQEAQREGEAAERRDLMRKLMPQIADEIETLERRIEAAEARQRADAAMEKAELDAELAIAAQARGRATLN